MNETLNVVDQFKVNTIIWLRSLPDEELGPSQRMIEDIEAFALTRGALNFEEITVGTSAEMLAALNKLVLRCTVGLRPILHFDCHGSDQYGLMLAPSGDYFGWAELADALRAINVAAENNLCCIFGVCFGMYLSTELSLLQPTPYFLTIAPEREIAVGLLEARFPPFYVRLYETRSITQAYQEVLAPELKIFQCQEVFAKVLATYIVNHATGTAAASRRENLMTRLLAILAIRVPSRNQLHYARGQIKAAIKLTQETVDLFAPTFLIGRQPSVGLKEIRRLAEEMRRHRAAEKKRAQKEQKTTRAPL